MDGMLVKRFGKIMTARHALFCESLDDDYPDKEMEILRDVCYTQRCRMHPLHNSIEWGNKSIFDTAVIDDAHCGHQAALSASVG